MPRPNRAVDADEEVTSFVASAGRYNTKERKNSQKKAGAQWQEAAWHFYDVIGEFEFVANWTGNLLSRAKLNVTKDGKAVKKGDPGQVILDQFGGSKSDQARILSQFGIHFTVAGEAMLVEYEEDGRETWHVVAPQNITQSGDEWTINGKKIKDSDVLIIRMMTPHPRYPAQATAASRAALPILSEIERLTMHVAAQVDSRLASAGILLLPNEMTFGSKGSTNGEATTTSASAQAFVDELYGVMSASIQNRDDASSLVPIVITADGEYLDKPRLLEFWSSLDENAKELRSEAIRRLALSMDIPPEVLTGVGDANHWSAWSVDESAIKSHTEPLLLRLCNDLTEGYLYPALREMNPDMTEEEVRSYSITADTSEMRLRPNRSKEALELNDRGMLSVKATLRETGFDIEDYPDDKELVQWLYRKVASGSATPEMVAQALKVLGADKINAAGATPNESRPDPSLEEHPVTGPPEDQDPVAKATLMAYAEHTVFRAFERLGNKMKNQMRFTAKGVDPSEAYLFRQCTPEEAASLLEGSFTHLDRFASHLSVRPEVLADSLGAYCYDLVINQKPHSRDSLEVWVDRMEVS